MKQIINIWIKLGMNGWLSSMLWLSLASESVAQRYIFNQTEDIIKSYFGQPFIIEKHSSDPQKMIYTYSIISLREVLPELPEKATFKITYTNNRVADLWLTINALPDFPAGPYPEPFYLTQEKAFKLYSYIFAYSPPVWKEMDLPQGGGGHEGFKDQKYCYGDGVATTFMIYLQGEEDIRIFYDQICED
jgi:hypothetical protein